MNRVLLVTIAASSFVSSGLRAQGPVRAAVDSLLHSMVLAFKADPASVRHFYTDSSAILTSGNRWVGRAAVDGYWSQGMQNATWQVETLDAGGTVDAPWVAGRSNLASPTQGVSLTEFVGLLARGADGTLRFRVDAYGGLDGAHAASAADEAAIRGLDSLWAKVYATHDTAKALELYATSLVFLSANGQQKTRAEEMADIRSSPGLTMEYFRTTPAVVKTFQRMAIVEGRAEWKFAMNGRAREVSRHYTAIYSRGGPLGWRIVTLMMK